MIENKKYFLSICYESINSFFIADNIDNSQAIFMFASESFFGRNDIHGKEQYFHICRLRSIENRKPVVKCSNDGISFYCDEKGSIKYMNKEKKDVYKKIDIALKKGKTFYNHISGLYPYILLFLLVMIILIPKIKNCYEGFRVNDSH